MLWKIWSFKKQISELLTSLWRQAPRFWGKIQHPFDAKVNWIAARDNVFLPLSFDVYVNFGKQKRFLFRLWKRFLFRLWKRILANIDRKIHALILCKQSLFWLFWIIFRIVVTSLVSVCTCPCTRILFYAPCTLLYRIPCLVAPETNFSEANCRQETSNKSAQAPFVIE